VPRCAVEGYDRVGDGTGQVMNCRDVAVGNACEGHGSLTALERGDGSPNAIAVARPQVAEPFADLLSHGCRKLCDGQLLSEVCDVVD
jgi:hypothetical protein